MKYKVIELTQLLGHSTVLETGSFDKALMRLAHIAIRGGDAKIVDETGKPKANSVDDFDLLKSYLKDEAE